MKSLNDKWNNSEKEGKLFGTYLRWIGLLTVILERITDGEKEERIEK